MRGCCPQSSGSDEGIPCTSNEASWHLMLLKTGSSAVGLLSGAGGPVGPFTGIRDWDAGGLVGDSTLEPDGSGRVWYGDGLMGCSCRA